MGNTMSKKVLITGTNSKLGSAIRRYFADSDIDLDAVSLRDDAWKEQDWSGYDAVLHAAGITKTDTGSMSSEEEREYYRVNSELTHQIAQKAKSEGVRRFIFLSTMMVYANAAPVGRDRLITGETEPAPECVYGKSKLQGEGITSLSSDDFKVLIVREPVIYGESFDGEFNKLQNLAAKIGIFPDITSYKSYIYEGNLCELLRLAIVNELSGIVCPQNREVLTTSQIYAKMRKSYGKKCHLVKGFAGLLSLLSHVLGVINVIFGSLHYSEELSRIEGIDYQIYSLEESIKRINDYRKEHG